MADADHEWVAAWNCAWVHEATFLRSVLEAAGIEVLLPDEYTLSIDSFLAPALGGVRVMVRAKDLQSAREILESAADEAPDAP